MPNVNNIFRKGKVKKQNLDKFDVLVEENVSLGDLVVSKYFNISRFPGVVPRGNSYFEIEGSKLLKPEVELLFKTYSFVSCVNPEIAPFSSKLLNRA